jgi:hypothetical protein
MTNLVSLRLAPGYCLHHAHILRHLPEGFVLCQGRVRAHGLHCWLEQGNTVIDLTAAERFFAQADYYARNEITGSKVKKYTRPQVVALEQSHGGIDSFWEF